MTIVHVAALRKKLSYYLRLVKQGEEIVVTSHRHRVARILPLSAPDAQLTEPSRPLKDLKKVKGVKPQRSVSAVRALLQDRERR